MDGWLDASIIAALIAGAFSFGITGWSLYVARRLRAQHETRERTHEGREREYETLSLQLEGWKSLVADYRKDATAARDRIRILEEDGATTRRHLAECEAKTTEQNQRIGQLERRLGLESPP